MYAIVVTVGLVLCFGVLVLLLVKNNYHTKLLHKWGIVSSKAPMNWTAFSWESCLNKLNHKANIVFFGDSIVRGGDFHLAFEQQRVVNLGCSGDTLCGMLRRVGMIQAVSPEKIFILAGINGLTDRNIKLCLAEYKQLLDAIYAALPAAEIYVHSVLPIAKFKEKQICKNTTIVAFNRGLKALAEEKGCTFIDLYSLYVLDGAMDPALTQDGLHLKPEAYTRWIQAIGEFVTTPVAEIRD